MDKALCVDMEQAIKCSNYIGEALDFATELGFESLLLIGHAGKLVKLGVGVMNTHSRYADARMEALALHAALQGAGAEVLRSILACTTTEEAVLLLDRTGLKEAVFQSLMLKVSDYVQKRVQYGIKTAVLVFSNELGILGQTEHASELLKLHRRREN
jgi:cobalt-precorrin-5B (C1)-methyltransferase